MQEEFADKVALVTGAGSGMGRATAILLAKRGAAVTLVGRRENKLAQAAAEITAAGGKALAHPGDVSRSEDNERCGPHRRALRSAALRGEQRTGRLGCGRVNRRHQTTGP
ncbi:SDR family NAD(P)-dependent oxidoreductase [Dactylosporangium salmoneum]|uniref:SDR family NAD(P)-dependent oxidoreductase n=1 Tax=Dactylosporangium salmoneum TaxID=53361 RepID=A0ABN3FLX2_9ACTN